MATCLIIDDEPLSRDVLRKFIAEVRDLNLLGECGDAFEASSRLANERVDLIFLDINMPGCDGLEATEKIKQESPSITIVMLTVRDEDEKLFQAIRSGAQGYLLKNIRSWEMVNLLRGAVQGEAAITPALAGRMLEEFRQLGQRQAHRSPDDDPVILTTREQDVLSLVATCASDKEIADQLCISVHTVKSHMRNILAKLQLGRRHEAALFAMREGLIRPPNGDSQIVS